MPVSAGELRLGGRLCTGGRAVVSPGCGHRAVAGAEPQLAGAGRPGEPCQLRAAFPKAQEVRGHPKIAAAGTVLRAQPPVNGMVCEGVVAGRWK